MEDCEDIAEDLEKIFRKRGIKNKRDKIRCLMSLTGTVEFRDSSKKYTQRNINEIPNYRLDVIERRLFSSYCGLVNRGCWEINAA